MARLERNGNVHTAGNADLLRRWLGRRLVVARLRGEDVTMVAGHRSAVADLNERAREVLRAGGHLGLDVLATDDQSFAVGTRCSRTRSGTTSACSTATAAS